MIRLGIDDFGGRERSGIPGEAQRDQVRIRRHVGVDVVALAELQRKLNLDRGSRLGRHRLRLGHQQTHLRETLVCAKQSELAARSAHSTGFRSIFGGL